MKVIEDIFYTKSQSPMQTLDVYLPDAESFPVVIYFHYGGFTGGDKKGYKFIPYLVERGVAVISANYRMYPEAAFPDFIRDGAMAVKWAMKHMPEYGEVKGYFIAGSSAGGYMSQLLCLDKKYLKLVGIDSDEITGYIMDAGQPTTHFNVLVERGMDKRRVVIDEAAPIYHITDGRNYPPMQIIVAENDLRNRNEQNALLVSTLKHFGCEEEKIDYRVMPGYKHVKYVNEITEDGRSIFADVMYEFISKYA
ncbi:MAG: alpha/beta hydrolase [Oscillospiraceae bacterium]|nr:alpha/beta hydrolase [Oscillospiraceae bacterium]